MFVYISLALLFGVYHIMVFELGEKHKP